MKNLFFENPRWTLTGLLGVVVMLVLLLVPHYTVISGSMEPTVPVGTRIFLGPASTLQPTDVITFQQEGDDHPTTHTFIGYADDGSLMTKGDANPTPDVHQTPLTMDDVKGRVIFMLTPIRAIGLLMVIVAIIIVVPMLFKGKETSKVDEMQSNTTDTPRVTTPA